MVGVSRVFRNVGFLMALSLSCLAAGQSPPPSHTSPGRLSPARPTASAPSHELEKALSQLSPLDRDRFRRLSEVAKYNALLAGDLEWLTASLEGKKPSHPPSDALKPLARGDSPNVGLFLALMSRFYDPDFSAFLSGMGHSERSTEIEIVNKMVARAKASNNGKDKGIEDSLTRLAEVIAKAAGEPIAKARSSLEKRLRKEAAFRLLDELTNGEYPGNEELARLRAHSGLADLLAPVYRDEVAQALPGTPASEIDRILNARLVGQVLKSGPHEGKPDPKTERSDREAIGYIGSLVEDLNVKRKFGAKVQACVEEVEKGCPNADDLERDVERAEKEAQALYTNGGDPQKIVELRDKAERDTALLELNCRLPRTVPIPQSKAYWARFERWDRAWRSYQKKLRELSRTGGNLARRHMMVKQKVGFLTLVLDGRDGQGSLRAELAEFEHKSKTEGEKNYGPMADMLRKSVAELEAELTSAKKELEAIGDPTKPGPGEIWDFVRREREQRTLEEAELQKLMAKLERAAALEEAAFEQTIDYRFDYWAGKCVGPKAGPDDRLVIKQALKAYAKKREQAEAFFSSAEIPGLGDRRLDWNDPVLQKYRQRIEAQLTTEDEDFMLSRKELESLVDKLTGKAQAKRQGKEAKLHGLLEALRKYGIKWNGSLVDWRDAEPWKANTPEKKKELKETLVALGEFGAYPGMRTNPWKELKEQCHILYNRSGNMTRFGLFDVSKDEKGRDLAVQRFQNKRLGIQVGGPFTEKSPQEPVEEAFARQAGRWEEHFDRPDDYLYLDFLDLEEVQRELQGEVALLEGNETDKKIGGLLKKLDEKKQAMLDFTSSFHNPLVDNDLLLEAMKDQVTQVGKRINTAVRNLRAWSGNFNFTDSQLIVAYDLALMQELTLKHQTHLNWRLHDKQVRKSIEARKLFWNRVIRDELVTGGLGHAAGIFDAFRWLNAARYAQKGQSWYTHRRTANRLKVLQKPIAEDFFGRPRTPMDHYLRDTEHMGDLFLLSAPVGEFLNFALLNYLPLPWWAAEVTTGGLSLGGTEFFLAKMDGVQTSTALKDAALSAPLGMPWDQLATAGWARLPFLRNRPWLAQVGGFGVSFTMNSSLQGFWGLGEYLAAAEKPPGLSGWSVFKDGVIHGIAINLQAALGAAHRAKAETIKASLLTKRSPASLGELQQKYPHEVISHALQTLQPNEVQRLWETAEKEKGTREGRRCREIVDAVAITLHFKNGEEFMRNLDPQAGKRGKLGQWYWRNTKGRRTIADVVGPMWKAARADLGKRVEQGKEGVDDLLARDLFSYSDPETGQRLYYPEALEHIPANQLRPNNGENKHWDVIDQAARALGVDPLDVLPYYGRMRIRPGKSVMDVVRELGKGGVEAARNLLASAEMTPHGLKTVAKSKALTELRKRNEALPQQLRKPDAQLEAKADAEVSKRLHLAMGMVKFGEIKALIAEETTSLAHGYHIKSVLDALATYSGLSPAEFRQKISDYWTAQALATGGRPRYEQTLFDWTLVLRGRVNP